MSDFAFQPSSGQALTADPSVPPDSGQMQAQTGPSAGVMIRRAREAAGLHIAALAVSLKVPVKKLEALEADRLDLLPDPVFVRALAASVCRTLKLDPAGVLALLPQTGKPNLGQTHTAINTPFRAPGDGPGPTVWAQISRPAVLAGLLLLMAAIVLLFLPAARQQAALSLSPSEPPAAAAAPGVPAPQAGVAMAKPEMVEADKPASSAAAAEPGAAPPSAAALPLAPALAPSLAVLPTPVVALAPAPAAAATPTAAPAGIIVFRAKGESWVEVTDAKNVVVLRRTLLAGEEVGATGALPLTAVVGRADATQVQVRGQAFDLGTVSKDNVARFEVK